MRTNTLIAGLLAIAGFTSLPGCASPTASARLVEVSIVNRSTGERLTPYRHDGRLYVAGTPGERYAVELKNRGGERVLTVVAVDGVNVLTGQTAAALQSGYVLDAWRSYGISGWRKSMDEVAQFVFTALPDSYAARTGRPDNVGVIGVAVFREQPEVAPVPDSPPLVDSRPRPVGKLESNAPAANSGVAKDLARAAPAAPQPAESGADAVAKRRDRYEPETREKLGTGHGERERSPTRQTDFVRASDVPAEVVTIYYDSRANLVARGIIRSPRIAEPKPFPGGVGFVPDPRG